MKKGMKQINRRTTHVMMHECIKHYFKKMWLANVTINTI